MRPTRQGKGRFSIAAIAVVTMLALTGCTVPLLGVELPFELPSLPTSLSIPQVELPGTRLYSADELRAERLAKNTVKLKSSSLLEEGRLWVGLPLHQTSLPLCYQYTDETLGGIDVELGARLAEDLGLKVGYVTVSDPASALGKSCDVVMGVSTLEQNVSLAGLYAETAIAFYRRGAEGIATASELNGKSVGIQDGSASQAALERTGLMMGQTTYADLNSAFEALAAGQVNYVLCEAYAGAYLSRSYEGIAFAGCLELPIAQGVAVSPTNADLFAKLQAALVTMRSNGVYEAMRHPWVGSLPTLDESCVIANIPAAPTKASDTAAAATTTGTGKVGGHAVTNI